MLKLSFTVQDKRLHEAYRALEGIAESVSPPTRVKRAVGLLAGLSGHAGATDGKRASSKEKAIDTKRVKEAIMCLPEVFSSHDVSRVSLPLAHRSTIFKAINELLEEKAITREKVGHYRKGTTPMVALAKRTLDTIRSNSKNA